MNTHDYRWHHELKRLFNLALDRYRAGERDPARCCDAFGAAYLDTIGRSSGTYGRFEIRAKAPSKGAGTWPAFWLRPEDGGHGEIDVVELPDATTF